MFFLTWIDLVIRGDGAPLWGRGGFANIPVFGILALFFLWRLLLVLLPITLVLGLILERTNFRSFPAYIACGSLIGLAFMTWVAWQGVEPFSTFDALAICSGTPAGGICGWIYWRIAVQPSLIVGSQQS
jgi:hypothetical protein